MHETTRPFIDRLTQAVNDVADWPFPESDAVDVAGILRHAETRLAEVRRKIVSELEGNEEGELYRASESRSARRSYNTDGLLAAFGKAWDMDPSDSLMSFLAADAVRLQWRWTELQRLAELWNVRLPKAWNEISDGDPEALVGEVWSSRISIEAVEDE